MGRLAIPGVVLLLMAAHDPVPPPIQPFAVASVHFERNATDGDVEVVFEAKGGDEGLATLVVRGPDGRTVVSFTAPDASTLGMRQFRFESPEPRDVKALKAAYPEGTYSFSGSTASGSRLEGVSKLSHKLPPPTSLVHPTANTGVPSRNLAISWRPVQGLAAYIVYIEQDDLGVQLTTRLPPSATSFPVPDGFLRPGTTYQLGLGTVTSEGNTTYVETSFTTADGF